MTTTTKVLILIAAAAGIGAAIYTANKGLSTAQKRQALFDLDKQTSSGSNVWFKMTPAEVDDCYWLLFQAKSQGINFNNMPDDRKARLNAISAKYNIFT